MYAAWPANAGYHSFSSFHGPAADRRFDELVADPPAAVAPLDDVDPARPVAAVGVVVAGEEIAVLIECQLLRVAEPGGEDLQLGAVGVAAQDRAGVGNGERVAVDGRHVEPAVADAEIEPAIRARTAGRAGRGPGSRRGRRTPRAGALRRSARPSPSVSRSFQSQGMHAYQTSSLRASTPAPMPAAGSLNPSAKTVAASARPSPSRSTIRRTRSCCDVDTLANPAPEVFLVHRHAVGDRPAGQVVVEPVHVLARVGHPVAEAKRLGDVDDPFFIDAEGDRVGQERLGREQLDGQPSRHAERPDRSLRLHPTPEQSRDQRFWTGNRVAAAFFSSPALAAASQNPGRCVMPMPGPYT